jgi:hypothetical protein
MKKIFIGLLAIAAGTAIYFYVQTKKTGTRNAIDHELLAGKWKIDTLFLYSKDSSSGLMTGLISIAGSNFKKYSYNFRKEGTIFQLLNDSVTVDTSYYEWSTNDDLVWKEAKNDSTSEVFSVSKLNADSLILHSEDSVRLVFTKLK